MNPIVSVIIPSYKPGDYIWECLDSLSMQTFDRSKFEVILILNGCNEPWKSQIQNWCDSHSDIDFKLIQTDTPGVSNARNVGIGIAKGEYIFFLDDDDYITPSYLQLMCDRANAGSVVVSDSRAFISETNENLDSYKPHITYLRYAKENNQNLFEARSLFNHLTMKLFPKDFFEKYKFDTALQNGEDGLLMFQISYKIKRICYAGEDAVYYRRYRESSLTTSKRNTMYWVNNKLKIQNRMLKAWICAPWSYNFMFFASRLAANIKGGIRHLMR